MNKNLLLSIAIVAHVDHGKSTFCDSLIELCIGKVLDSKIPSLDSHEIERKRGVTIRNHFINLSYKDFEINLIDTPGHYDFSQYVRLGVYIADLVILLIDCTKGIQAQTINYLNMCKLLDKNFIIIINKIDLLDSFNINKLIEALNKNYNFLNILQVSAKNRINIPEVLEYCLKEKFINSTKDKLLAEFETNNSSLIFYLLNVENDKKNTKILLIYIIKGTLEKNKYVKFENERFLITNIYLQKYNYKHELEYLSSSSMAYVRIVYNNSLVLVNKMGSIYIDGKVTYSNFNFDKYTSYIGIYSNDNPDKLREVLNQAILEDSSVYIERKYSYIYKECFLCKFFGNFHKEIFLEKIKLEYDIDYNFFIPDIEYKNIDTNIITSNLDEKELNDNYKRYLQKLHTPFINLEVQSNIKNYDKISSKFNVNKYYSIENVTFIMSNFILNLLLPLSDFIYKDIPNTLKNITSGYCEIVISNDLRYFRKELVFIKIKVNEIYIEELSFIDLEYIAIIKYNLIVNKLLDKLERKQVNIKISVFMNNKVIHTKIIKRFRKDVTQKLYGGDSTRRMKLLKKQKIGKSKMSKYTDTSYLKGEIINLLKT